ncbi:hypothetical protein [Nostoc sp.]|uniref:hypothetical protein n=1 Tax=Nostoc sp. TaxID=1180 RepID=UPI002FF627C3
MTERIDGEKAAKVVKAAYTVINKQNPEIIFCESPYAGLKIIYQKLPNLSFNNLEFLCLNNKLCGYITANLTNKDREFSYQINTQIFRHLTIVEPSLTPREYILEDKLQNQPKFNIYLGDSLWLNLQNLANRCCHVDFYISVLNYSYSKKRWETLQSLSRFCGWISPFEKFCISCRAYKLHIIILI